MWWEKLLNHSKNRYIFAVTMVFMIGGFFWWQQNASQSEIQLTEEVMLASEESTVSDDSSTDSDVVASEMYVELKGQVKKPGVYPIINHMRLGELIKEAGGLTAQADQRVINQAMILKDQQSVYVPKIGEIEAPLTVEMFQGGESRELHTDAGKGKVNLNESDTSQLETLPGIGKAKAEAIISYRQENGLFKTIEELEKVSGFGQKTVERLKDLITV